MLPLTSIPTTFVHLNSFSLHPLWSLFTFPLLDRLQPALQAVQTVLHSASLFRARSEQRQHDAPQHQAAQSDRRGVCTGGLVSHDQSEKPERQDGFNHPKHPPHHANQQAENNGQHPVANEAHQTPLGDGRHALWSEAGQRQGNCGGRKFSLSTLLRGTKHLCVTQEATEVNTHTYKRSGRQTARGRGRSAYFHLPLKLSSSSRQLPAINYTYGGDTVEHAEKNGQSVYPPSKPVTLRISVTYTAMTFRPLAAPSARNRITISKNCEGRVETCLTLLINMVEKKNEEAAFWPCREEIQSYLQKHSQPRCILVAPMHRTHT